MQIEKLKASQYYGKHATGVVVLINGYPKYHATGQTAKKDAQDFINTITIKRN